MQGIGIRMCNHSTTADVMFIFGCNLCTTSGRVVNVLTCRGNERNKLHARICVICRVSHS